MIAIHLAAPNDSNGNPRRLFVVYGDEAMIVAVVDEGYHGHGALRAAGFAGIPVSSRIEIPASQYRDFLRLRDELNLSNNPTRKAVLDSYQINHVGRIISPGKFEGEMVYLPHFWGISLDGFADEHGEGVFSVEIEEKDREAFPELGKRKRIKFYERGDGFVTEV